MTAASTIAAIHISPRNIELTDDQLTNSSGCILSFHPRRPSDQISPARAILRACFLSAYPLLRGPTQTNRTPPLATPPVHNLAFATRPVDRAISCTHAMQNLPRSAPVAALDRFCTALMPSIARAPAQGLIQWASHSAPMV
jgi:hypothetical protein